MRAYSPSSTNFEYELHQAWSIDEFTFYNTSKACVDEMLELVLQQFLDPARENSYYHLLNFRRVGRLPSIYHFFSGMQRVYTAAGEVPTTYAAVVVPPMFETYTSQMKDLFTTFHPPNRINFSQDRDEAMVWLRRQQLSL